METDRMDSARRCPEQREIVPLRQGACCAVRQGAARPGVRQRCQAGGDGGCRQGRGAGATFQQQSAGAAVCVSHNLRSCAAQRLESGTEDNSEAGCIDFSQNPRQGDLFQFDRWPGTCDVECGAVEVWRGILASSCRDGIFFDKTGAVMPICNVEQLPVLENSRT